MISFEAARPARCILRAATLAVTVFCSVLASPPVRGASSQICQALSTRLLSAARHDAITQVDRAESEGVQVVAGFDQTGRLLGLLPATGLPTDPSVTLLSPDSSVADFAGELDLPFDLTHTAIEMVPDLEVDLANHYRRILRNPTAFGLSVLQCHLPELAFGGADRTRPELHVLKEFRDVEQPDCEPLGYLGMQYRSVSYDLVETRNEVFVYRNADLASGNAPTCSFGVLYTVSDALIGRCNSDFCRHVQDLAKSAPLPLFWRNTGRTSDLTYGPQIQRVLSSDRYSVTFHHPWALWKLPKLTADLLKSVSVHSPLTLFEVATASKTVFMGVYLRVVNEQPSMIARFFSVDRAGATSIIDELPIASMTVLGGIFEITAQRSMKFK